MGRTIEREKRGYEYPGEAIAGVLVEWLNGPGAETFDQWRNTLKRRGLGFSGGADADCKARERMIGLLSDLKELRRIGALLLPDDRTGRQTFERLTEKINGLLSKYRRHDQIICTEPMLGSVDQAPPPPYFWGSKPDLRATPLQELWAIQRVRELDEEFDRDGRALLDRVKRCAACEQWMYARKNNQRSHTEVCRRETYKKDRRAGRQHKKYLAELQARKAGGTK